MKPQHISGGQFGVIFNKDLTTAISFIAKFCSFKVKNLQSPDLGKT